MDSWKKYMPEYQYMLWNEESFDIKSNTFTKQAYENKKWAFVSDYVRIYALNKFGGWYLDTDVEILKPLSPFENNRIVLGTDHDGALTALMGSEPFHPYWETILKKYNKMNFVHDDGTLNMVVNNTYLQEELQKYGYRKINCQQVLENGIVVYPDDYFHVANVELGTLHKTKNSYAIHWHTLLWTSEMSRFNRYLRLHILKPIFGVDKFMNVYKKLTKWLKRK